MLDITKPMQFREPHYGTIIDVIPNPNGEKDSRLIVNLVRDKIIYTAFRAATGRMEVEELNGDIVNVPEKKKYSFWLLYWDDGGVSTMTSMPAYVQVGYVSDRGPTLLAKEFVEREIEV